MVYSKDNSLMEKFKLRIEQLDYKYIKNCKDIKELGKILRVLRSGEEGVFPDLISYCEKKLHELDSSHKLLHKEKFITHYSELKDDERIKIQEDLKIWEYDLSGKECYNEERVSYEMAKKIPPIRSQKSSKENNSGSLVETMENGATKKVVKRHVPRNYKDWDRFNVEEELQKLDDGNIIKHEPEKSNTDETQISDSISTEGLSLEELERFANLEHVKGNEAYKAKEYEEAIVYYTRSLSAFKMSKTLNNRAQTYIKLKNYVAAVIDCNEVICMESDNLKAYYRRGLAHKEAEMFDLALLDFHIALKIDPQCQAAKEQLQQMKDLVSKKEEKKVLIEELESNVNEDYEDDSNLDEVMTKVTIEEVQEEENSDDNKRPLLDELCHFNDDQHVLTQPLSRKTLEMLMITNQENSENNESFNKSKTNCISQNKIEDITDKVSKLSERKRNKVEDITEKRSKQSGRKRNIIEDITDKGSKQTERKRVIIEDITEKSSKQSERNIMEDTLKKDSKQSERKGIIIEDITEKSLKQSEQNIIDDSIEKVSKQSEGTRIIIEDITEKSSQQSERNTMEDTTEKVSKQSERKRIIIEDITEKSINQSEANKIEDKTEDGSKEFEGKHKAITSEKIHSRSLSPNTAKCGEELKAASIEIRKESSENNNQSTSKNPAMKAFDDQLDEKEIETHQASLTEESNAKQAEINKHVSSQKLSKESMSSINNVSENLYNTKTPSQFFNMWSSHDANRNSKQGTDILLAVKPDQLPKILTNKLDSALLYGLMKAIGNLIKKGDYSISLEYLKHLVTTPRISITAMLLTKQEKTEIIDLLSIMRKKHETDVLHIRKILNF